MYMVPPNSRIGQQYSKLIDRKPTTIFSEVYCGLECANGDIWLGADRGILCLEQTKREWRLYPLPENLIQAARIYEGRDGRIWFADVYGNSAVYDKLNHTWSGYKVCDPSPRKRDSSGSSDYSINAIYQDTLGHVLFGTFNGLVVFTERENKWERFTAENSILPGVTLIGSDKPTSKVTALMEDHSGRIWIATNGGIVILDR